MADGINEEGTGYPAAPGPAFEVALCLNIIGAAYYTFFSSYRTIAARRRRRYVIDTRSELLVAVRSALFAPKSFRNKI